MKTVFADAFYWAALANPKDEWHPAAMRAGVQHQIGVIITTDEVLLHFDGNDARAQAHRSSHARPPFPSGRFHAFAHRQKRMTNSIASRHQEWRSVLPIIRRATSPAMKGRT